MKKLRKFIVIAIGISSMLLMLNLLSNRGTSIDMESAKGSSPSPSYKFELQIFHAF